MRIDARCLKVALLSGIGFVGVPVTLAQAAPISFANAVLADNPLAYWRFNESAGATTAVDSSVNANNGTYSSTGIVLGQPGIGGGDTAALFSNGRIVVADSSTLNPGNITIEALIDWAGANGFQQRIIEKSRFTGGALPQYGLNILPDGRVLFEIQVGATNSAITSIGAIQQGVGVDVAATFDGNLMRLYINGVLDSSLAPVLTGPLPHDLTNVGIGNQVDRDRPFNGIIDELALFNSALSADSLAAHTTAATVPEPATIAMLSIGLLGVARRARGRPRREESRRA